ncbi:MAG TPA: hypothetical protein ENN83_15970 [Rhodovulum sp.]|nr:hypothetical protein [Rhodovulum sp.]
MASRGAERATTVAPPTDFLDGFISEEEYAARRGVSLRTCQRDRQLRQSPPFVVIGRRVYYRIEAVRDWLLAREQQASRKPSAPRAGRGR